jgi:hypothetical protein
MGLESITRKGAGTTRSIDNQSGAWRADADTRVSARKSRFDGLTVVVSAREPGLALYRRGCQAAEVAQLFGG